MLEHRGSKVQAVIVNFYISGAAVLTWIVRTADGVEHHMTLSEVYEAFKFYRDSSGIIS